MTEVSQSSPVTGKVFVLRILASGEQHRAGEEIRVSDPVTIGRDEGCGVVLVDPSVSRRHARLVGTPEGLKVVDLGSGNGVWAGSKRVKELVLAMGDQFRIGSTVFEYFGAVVVDPESSSPTALLPPPVRPPEAPPPLVLQIVDATDTSAIGTEFELTGGALTIGRSTSCAIVLNERDISRTHARIELTPDGYRLVDAGSSTGTWMGSREIKSEMLRPGDRFRLGSRVVIECRLHLPSGATPSTPVADADSTGSMSPEEIARAMGPHGGAPPVPEPASRPAPPRVQPADDDSTRLVSAEEAARYASPPPAAASPLAAVSDQDFHHTVVIRMPLPAPEARRIEDEGEPVEASAHKPFLLDDPSSVWYVVEGGILIFTVALEKGEPVGTRTHFLGIVSGQVIFGFDLRRYNVGSGFLAVAKQGTKLRKLSLARMQQLAADPVQGAAIAPLVDAWVTGLSTALVVSIQPNQRSGGQLLKPGQRVELTKGTKATAEEGVLWLNISSGSVVFDDLETPTFKRRNTLFPLSAKAWIRPVSDEFGPLSIKPAATTTVAGMPLFWHGLDVFHEVLCKSEFVTKKLATVDEFLRLQQKAQRSEAAGEAALSAVASVLSTEGSQPQEFLVPGEAEPVLQACTLVGRRLGIEVKPHPSSEEGLTFEQQVLATSMASRFRTRVVALRDQWFREDNGPLLGQLAATKDPVALLPVGAKAYQCVDPKTGSRTPVTARFAESLSGFAYQFYRTFPDGDLKVSDVIRFGALGLRSDLRWVALLAVVVGLFGTVTPFITGRVFDLAIPQADRSALIGFGVALLMAALATSAFKLTQGVATVRIQARMASCIQSAVWDRILNLPVNFFRKYSAGDLADRAEGVGAIQHLIAGAGVAAILGSVSGLFFILQMFSYNLRLALLAILLTAIYVGTNMMANYLQLRYQRQEYTLRGRIAGLVLNLLTGVTKLRVCGAEQHAFRVWAEQFARQRRLTFSIGSIQNAASAFAAVFPIISSIAIFYTMISVQASAATSGGESLTTGDFIAFNAAFALFLASMQALGDASLSLLRVVPIYERLAPVLTTPPEVDASKAFPGKLKGEIELSHVHFRYDPDGPWIINDVSLKIKPGEFVAFVGSSGGGKSTLMRLMLGFEQPTRGAVLFDGQDLSALDLRLVRQQLGVVLQASRVMPTEIYRNIIGVSSRTIEDAWDAAEKASLAEDIRQMPMGMHTYVSEGGGTLSGGQRQRLMIARAIANKPKILFLDEATSALDNKAQAVVTASMDKMESTRIVIAHRLSTVVNANRICFLDGGTIAEMGTYNELMAKNGLFAQLARRQLA